MIPTYTGSYEPSGEMSFARAVEVVGGLAYIAAYSGFHIIDVSNPMSPTFTGIYTTTAASINIQAGGELGPIARDVQVIDNLAYVAYEGLRILDISNPADPVLRGKYDTLALGVQVVDDLAYVAAGTNGLQILDISNPARLC
jgi:hypothetical protein